MSVSTTRISFLFDVPNTPPPLQDDDLTGLEAKRLSVHHAAGLALLDGIEQDLKLFRNRLRDLREEIVRQRQEVNRQLSKQWLEALPNEVLVEIFRFATFKYERDSRWPTPPLQRSPEVTPSSLSDLASVCQRWKEVVESFVCMFTPRELHMVIDEASLLEGVARKIRSESRFSGPLILRFECGREDEDLGDSLAIISRSLAEPHRAVLSVSFYWMPIGMVQRLLTTEKSFPRVAAVSITIRLSDLEVEDTPLSIPEFPILCIISLVFGESWYSGAPEVVERSIIASERWRWLFSPAMMQQLRSFRSSHFLEQDSLWLLAHAPELKELLLPQTMPSKGYEEFNDASSPILSLSHPKVKRVSFGGQRKTSFDFPSLSTFVSGTDRYQSISLSRLSSSQRAQNLTHMRIRLAGNGFTASPLHNITHLQIDVQGHHSMGTFANLVEEPMTLPLLRFLIIAFLPDFNARPRSSSLFGDVAAVVRALKQLSGRAKMKILDFRFFGYGSRDYDACGGSRCPELRGMAHLLNAPAGELRQISPRPDHDTPFDFGLNEIRKCLDFHSKQAKLADISKMWTEFVTKNRNMAHAAFKYECWTEMSVLWNTIERLEDIFEGLPYPLHQDITDGWKTFLGPTAIGWMVSVNLDMQQYTGLFYGPRMGSLVYDIRRGIFCSAEPEGTFRPSYCGHPKFDLSQEALEALGVVLEW